MKLEDIYKNYKTAPVSFDVNQYLLPKIVLPMESYLEFNELLSDLLNLEKAGDISRGISRTKSGGISIAKHCNLYRGSCYDVVAANSFVSLTVLHVTGMFQLVLTNKKDFEEEDKGIGGARAFFIFKQICKNHGVDLEEFAIENGLDVKRNIPAPKICVAHSSFMNLTLENCFHVDLNTAYMAGIAKAFPALEAPIREIYDKKNNVDRKYKAILNYTYGYMQSKYVGYRFSHMSKEAHLYTQRMLEHVSKLIVDNDCVIIGYNTDGVWAQGDPSFINDSSELGQFRVDHKNCKLRFKSAGAYEYIEEGKYHPVIRGKTALDKSLHRSEWKWGDIYSRDCRCVKYRFKSYEEGIIKYEE